MSLRDRIRRWLGVTAVEVQIHGQERDITAMSARLAPAERAVPLVAEALRSAGERLELVELRARRTYDPAPVSAWDVMPDTLPLRRVSLDAPRVNREGRESGTVGDGLAHADTVPLSCLLEAERTRLLGRLVARMLTQLTPRARLYVSEVYGLAGEPLTHKQVAARHGVTRVRR